MVEVHITSTASLSIQEEYDCLKTIPYAIQYAEYGRHFIGDFKMVVSREVS